MDLITLTGDVTNDTPFIQVLMKSFAGEALSRIKELTDVLGLFGGEDEEEGLGDDIQALIEERQTARKEKNWAKADAIRDQLAAMGITLKDTPQGVQVIRN